MSYILDALKKSEQERRQQSGESPTLQTVHRPKVGVEPKSAWPLAISLLVLAALVIAVWLIWPRFSVTLNPELERTAVKVSVDNGEPKKTSVEGVAITDSTSVASEKAQGITAAPSPVVELWELPDNVQAQIPALTFSFHVYSENPARRTIIINNRRVNEGAKLSDKLVLQEITSDGVVLAWEQFRFRIPVVEAW